MKLKQKSVRIFELECNLHDNYEQFIDKNRALFEGYCVVLVGEGAKDVHELLFQKGIVSLLAWEHYQSKVQKEELVTPHVTTYTSCELKKELVPHEHTLVFNRPIRSGEEITSNYDIILYERVNDGAKIISQGNIIALGTIDGTVQCEGETMILHHIGKGTVFFKGDMVNSYMNGDIGLKKLFYTSEGIVIKDI